MGNQQGQPIPTDEKSNKKKNKNNSVVSHHNSTPVVQNTQPPRQPSPQKPPSTPTIDLLSGPLPTDTRNQRNTLNPTQANPVPSMPIANKPSLNQNTMNQPQQHRPTNPSQQQQRVQQNISPQRQPNTNQPPPSNIPQKNVPIKETPQIPSKIVVSDEFLCGMSPQCGTSYSACHLNITGLEQVTLDCILETKPVNFKIDHWLIYVPIPPLTSFQGEGKLTIKLPSNNTPICNKVIDSQGRELLQVVIPIDQHPHFVKNLKLIATFEVSLFTRELFYDPNVQIPYQIATQQEVENATADGGPYILRNADFQNYINANKNILYRNQSEIRDEAIIYAQRVFHFIGENFTASETVSDHSICRFISF